MSTVSLIISIVLSLSLSSGLDPDLPPGKNFDLSHFALQTCKDGNGEMIEVKPADLTNGFTNPDFYTDKSDGSMTFYVEGQYCTTGGSKYPRSELRQFCNPSKGSGYNWHPNAFDGILNGTYQIRENEINGDDAKATIQQIKGVTGGELIFTYWELDDNKKGNVYIVYHNDTSGKGYKTSPINVDYNKFTIHMIVKNKAITIYVNNALKVHIPNADFWGNECCYFKSGDYLQTNVANHYVKVHVYDLKVTQSSGCTSC